MSVEIAGEGRSLYWRVTRGALGLMMIAGCAAQAPVRVPEPAVVTPVAAVPVLPPLPVVPVEAAPARPLANFGVLARGFEEFEAAEVWWSVGERIERLTPELANLLGATQWKRAAELPRWLRGYEPKGWVGDAVLMSRSTERHREVALVDGASLTRRWRLRLAGELSVEVTPRVLVVKDRTYQRPSITGYGLGDGREVWRIRDGAGVASAYSYESWINDERLFVWDRAQLQAFDVATGVRVWGVPVQHDLVVDMWSADGRLFMWSYDGLAAYDEATGATLWGSVPVARSCGLVPGPHVIVVEEENGYGVIDPANGAVLRRIPATGLCLLREWNEVYHPGVTDGRRLVVLEPRVPGYRSKDNPTTMVAYDLETATVRWSRKMLDSHGPILDRDAVYVIRDFKTVLALDADSGETRAEISLGWDPRASGHSLTYSLRDGGAAGPMLLVDSSDSGVWLFGRLAEPTVREAYVIRGRVVAKDRLARARVAKVQVKVGGVTVETDAEGRFEARGEGLGVVSVSAAMARSFDAEGVLVDFETQQVVLAGKGAYDVEVELAATRRCRPGERPRAGGCAAGPGSIGG